MDTSFSNVYTWFNSENSEKTYTECQITIYQHSIKFVTVQIFLSTGVVLFKGPAHHSWPTRHITIIKNMISELDDNELTTLQANKLVATKLATSDETALRVILTSDDETPNNSPGNGHKDLFESNFQADSAQISPISLETNASTHTKIVSPVDMTVQTSCSNTVVVVPESPLASLPLDSNANDGDPELSSVQVPSPIAMSEMGFSDAENKNKGTKDKTPPKILNSTPNQDLLDIKSQFEGLWSENRRLNIALDNISNGVKNITSSIADFQKLVNSQNTKMEQTFKAIELKFDNKLKCFMEAYEATVDKKISAAVSANQKKVERYLACIESKISEPNDNVNLQASMQEISNKQNQDRSSLSTLTEVVANIRLELNNNSRDISQLATNVKSIKDTYDKPLCDVMHQVAEIKGQLRTNTGTIESINASVESLKNRSYSNTVSGTYNQQQLMQSYYQPNQLQPAMPPHVVQHANPETLSATNTILNPPENLNMNFPNLQTLNTGLRAPIPFQEPYNDPLNYYQGPGNVLHPNDNALTRTRNPVYKHAPHLAKRTDDSEILVCWDSNRKYVDTKLLWKANKTSYKTAPVLKEVFQIVDNTEYCNLSCILIHCGTNDLEAERATTGSIFKMINDLVEHIHAKYPTVKILLSELLPRNDYLDDAVMDINDKIINTYEKDKSVYVIRHRHLRALRRDELLSDKKHLRPEIAKRFAGSFRKGIQWAFDVPKNSQTNRTKRKDNNADSNSSARTVFATSVQSSGTDPKQDNGVAAFCNALQSFIQSYNHAG